MSEYLHQIYIGKMNKKTEELIDGVKQVNSDLKYIFWDKERVFDTYPELSSENYDDSNPVNNILKVDLVRFLILRDYGGWYLDTDCEAIKPLSNINNLVGDKDLITGIYYSEKRDTIKAVLNTHIIYSKKNGRIINLILNEFNKNIGEILKIPFTTVFKFHNIVMKNMGFDVLLLGNEFLTGKVLNGNNDYIEKNGNTYVVHHFNRDWAIGGRTYYEWQKTY